MINVNNLKELQIWRDAYIKEHHTKPVISAKIVHNKLVVNLIKGL